MTIFPCVVQYILVAYFIPNSLYLLIPLSYIAPSPSHQSIFFLNLFIFGCTGSSFLHVGFLQLQRSGATLRCGAQASHCGVFSCCRARAPDARASVVVARGLSLFFR